MITSYRFAASGLALALLASCETANSGNASLASNGRNGTTVSIYEFKVKNASSSTGSDDVTKRFAAALSKMQKGACIDLRMLGIASTGSKFDRTTIGLVHGELLREGTIDALKKAICGAAPNCSVVVERQDFRLSDLGLKNDKGVFSQEGPKIYPLQSVGMLPKFSDACDTGAYTDAWQDAGGTREAQIYLEKLGFETNSQVTINLTTLPPRDKTIFTFGFPR